MSQSLKGEISLLESELISLRRDFHQHPELGYQEFRTSGIIKEYLENLGLEVQIVTGTGVVGLLKGGKPGKTLLLRADMDALPQEEQAEVSYRSVNPGMMHGCGHDAHMAILMIAAKVLEAHKEELSGNMKFLFQPNEEEAGALNMITAGVLENPAVDGAVAVHIWTPIPSGKIGLSSGPVMAATEEFEITLIGKGGHTSAPHTAADAILAATAVVQGLQGIQTREIDPLIPITIMVGRIHGGTGRNIIADRVEIGGTIRFMFSDEKVEKGLLLEKFERVIKGICEGAGVQYELKYIPSNPTLVNDESMIVVLRNAARETFNRQDNVIAYRCMAGEDFAEFSQRVPSALYFLGTGNPDAGSTFPHHHPRFSIDESTMKDAVEIHVRAAMAFLS